MSQRKSLIVLVAFGLLACLDSTADARGFRVGLVPNGAENNCATCHNNPGGGGPRNSFGGDVGELVGRGSRDPFWSLDLAIQDSDSDGFTNGEELGDPDGDGVANRTVNISNPGLADDSPVAAVGDCNLDTTLNADDLSCISDIPARDAVLEALNTLPGDLDGNGQVEFGDFLVLSANFGTDSPAYTDGNIDLSGGVAFGDFLILSANFGQVAAGDLASVPEPSGAWLGFIGSTIVLIRRRRTRDQTALEPSA